MLVSWHIYTVFVVGNLATAKQNIFAFQIHHRIAIISFVSFVHIRNLIS